MAVGAAQFRREEIADAPGAAALAARGNRHVLLAVNCVSHWESLGGSDQPAAPERLAASPGTVKANGADTVRVTWTGSNADSCTLDGATAAKSGSKTFGSYSYSQTGTKSATVSCTNRLGSASDTATWKVDAPPPTVSASLSETTVTAGVHRVTLSWTSTYTDSCSYGGRTRATSGTVSDLGPFTAGKHSFTVSCTGKGGAASDTASLSAAEAPAVTVSVNPTSIEAGTDTSTLTWSSEHATSCSRGGTGVATSGSATVGPYDAAGTHNFTVSCSGPGGTASGTAKLAVEERPPPPPDPPVVSASLSPTTVTADTGTSTLSWSSTDATSCDLDGTTVRTSGGKKVGPYSKGTYRFTVSCTGAGGSDSDTARLTVVPLPAVTVSLSATTVTADTDTVDLTWSSTDATSCKYGSATLSTSGTRTVGPFSAGTHDLTVSCTGAGGTGSDTAKLTSVAIPTVTANFSPSTVVAHVEETTLSWGSTGAMACSLDDGTSLMTSGKLTGIGPFHGGSYKVTITCENSLGDEISKTVKVDTQASSTPLCSAYSSAPQSASALSIGTHTFSVVGSNSGSVWGTGTYVADSDIATAAVHAGHVSDGGKAIITLNRSSGQTSYTGSTKNGVTSLDHGSATDSYSMSLVSGCIADPPGAPESLEVTPSPSIDGDVEITWNAPSSGTAPTGYLVYVKDSVTGPLTKNFAERSLTLTGLEPDWHFFEVFACAGSESDPNCGSSASTTVQVLATFEELSLTGFDQNYRIRGKAGTNDFFVARENGLAGTPGVVGFYMKENKEADAAAYYNFMYPVTHESAKADGFTTQPNLALELIDANLDGNMDLMITGLENKTLSRWDMLIFSGNETGSFPQRRVELDPGFKKYFHEINEWYKSCDLTFGNCPYFVNNAKNVSVPKAAIFKAEKGFTTESAASLKLNEIKTNIHYASHRCNATFARCFVVAADSNAVTKDIASNSEVGYVPSPTWYKPRTIRDFDDNPDLPNLFFIIGLLYDPLDKETAKDFSAFSTAFETSYSLSRFIMDGEVRLESIEAMYLRMYLYDLFVSETMLEELDVLTVPLVGFEADAEAEIRFDFLMGMLQRFAQNVDQPEDIEGNPELDAFVLKHIEDLKPFLRAGYHERAFSIDLINGEFKKIREVIGQNDSEANLGVTKSTVAVVHTHPMSPIGLNPPNLNDPGLSEGDKVWVREAQSNARTMGNPSNDAMFSKLETECRNLPGPGDHEVLAANGVPNYILTPDGSVRVLERINGSYEVRTVGGSDYGGESINSVTYGLLDPQTGSPKIAAVPKQEDFVAGVSSPCDGNF